MEPKTLMELVERWRRICRIAGGPTSACADELEALVKEFDKQPFSIHWVRRDILGTVKEKP